VLKNENKNSIRRGRIFRYAPLILWIGVIFFLSSGQGAMSNTSRFIRPLLEFLFPGASEETLFIYHGIIRKLAHPSVYAVLAYFAYRAFYYSTQNHLQKYWFPVSLLLVFTVASLDELNQSFLASRTGSPYDILLDTIGGLVMLTILFFINRRRNNNNL
jgi:VanZ family protein